MYNKLECDTFVYEGTMLEQYSEGAWFKEDMSNNELTNGIIFRANSNITYGEFLKIQEGKFCVTVIDVDGIMKSWTNLSPIETIDTIEDNIEKLESDGKEFLTIFNMKDGISFDEYEKEL